MCSTHTSSSATDVLFREDLTIGKHAGRGQFDVGKSSEVVQHSTAVPILLGIIHKCSDIMLLTMVTDTRAYHHGDVGWRNRQMGRRKCYKTVQLRFRQ